MNWSYPTEWVSEFRSRRDFIYENLKDKYEIVLPEGAFYMFVKAPNDDGDEFVERAIKEELLLVPGSVFSREKTHFRLSFAASMPTLERAVEIFRKLC